MNPRGEWDKRPKGCKRTISGMHTPKESMGGYTITFLCSSCGLLDDTGEFAKWLGYESKKVDDTQEPKK